MRRRPTVPPISSLDLPRRRLLGAAAAAPLAGLAACAAPERGPPVPRGRHLEASVLGVPNERFLIGTPAGNEGIEREFVAAGERILRARPAGSTAVPSIDLIAISGGGENGAFGAGLLCGWTARGDRPVFELVSGISTGALTAPFAYLGSAYDAQLRTVYTELSAKDVLIVRGLLAALNDDALADTSPLFATISRYIDDAMLAAIARGYDEGRLLLIGTANLDAQLPVIWNIGAIAKSGHPRALETVRRVLLASAAIPAAFPPVLFNVSAGGEAFQELHVDGGAVAQAFLYPPAAMRQRRERMRSGQTVVPIRAFVIRNGRLDSEWAATERQTLTIAGRAIATMITAAGYNDVLRIYFNAQRDQIDYNLAWINRDFDVELKEPFEQAYMRQLFDFGYRRAVAGYPWAKQPPGV